MKARPSYWSSALGLTLVLAGGPTGPAGAAAQSELDGVCAAATAPLECNLAAAAVQLMQPRVGLALWGGNPVPGTASTVGLRRARTPRISAAARVRALRVTVPPLLDRTASRAEHGLVTSAALQSSFGLYHGFSPLPTVGGVLSVDALTRLAVARLPVGKGFESAAVWGWSAGVRLGLFRESFTLPGVSLTATYGRSSGVALGDAAGLTTDGAAEGAVSVLGAALVASRRVLGLRLAGGLSWDRYASDVTLRYTGPATGPGTLAGDAVLYRTAGFGSITWTRLIVHGSLEVGWQEAAPLPPLPPDVAPIDPAGLWLGLAIRVTP